MEVTVSAKGFIYTGIEFSLLSSIVKTLLHEEGLHSFRYASFDKFTYLVSFGTIPKVSAFSNEVGGLFRCIRNADVSQQSLDKLAEDECQL